MPEIKICGVNNLEFAVEAERLGANYLGFILVPGTPRYVTPEFVLECRKHLKGSAKVVLVVKEVDEALIKLINPDVVQLHKKATPEELAKIDCECWSLAGGAVRDGVLYDSTHA